MPLPFFNRSSRFDFDRVQAPRERRTRFSAFSRFRNFLAKLPSSDKAVAGALALLLALGLFASLGVFLRSFQVTIPAYGGSLSEGVVGSPRFINPVLAATDSDKDLTALTYAGLMGHDASGRLVPALAESYTVSPDGTMYTFILRGDAEFSDGIAVTADDVVYTVQKVQNPAVKSPAYASWANIRAEALDARTVRFTLPKAYTPFLEDTTLGILPKHIWQTVADDTFAFSPYDALPVGAGPFVASSISRDSEGNITEYSLKANTRYIAGRPYLSRIHFTFYASQAELQRAFANGDVQSAYGIPKEGVKTAPYARVFGVFFNSDGEPALKDEGVRKALSLAIDRTALTQQVLGGYATPLAGPLPAGSDVRALPLPDDATRLDAAKTALEDAGYALDDASGTWSKKGEQLSLTLDTSNVPELKAVAAEVQKDWQALGVPTELALHDPSELAQSVIRPRAYGALLFGEIIGTDPDLYAFWASDARTAPGLNIADYSDSAVDGLLDDARTASSSEAAAAALAEAQEAIAADYPAAFLYTPDFLYYVPSSIRGVSITGVSAPSDRFWGVANWYRYTEHVWPAFVPARAAGKSSGMGV